MKAEFREYDSSFSLEIIPENAEEVLRAARLGILAKKGAQTFIYFGEKDAHITLRFDKKRGTYPSIRK